MKPKLRSLGGTWAEIAALVATLVLGGQSRLANAQSLQDFGDAPSPYPTLLNNNGARHAISQGVFLGQRVDGELDGQPNATATGDDINPSTANDEDGVKFLTLLTPGAVATVQVVASTSGFLNAWIDFNINGSWADNGEQVFVNTALAAGTNVLNFAVPATALQRTTFARFRFATFTGLSFVGLGDNGEVEDYQVTISAPTQLDFGDAPDTPYPTIFRNNGARHVIDPTFYLGAKIDGETDGQPNVTATGDDINPSASDDEDGVAFTSALVPGQVATVEVTCTIPTGQSGRLNAWIDFDGNGSWADAGEQIFPNVAVVGGVNSLTFNVPASAKTGQTTYARFRLNRQGDLSYFGLAQDGEVEDYQVTISASAQLDFGDAPDPPYPTTLKNNGAWHNILQGFYLGARVDAEQDGQPNGTATGDDINPSTADDEDGVIFTSAIVPGRTANVQVIASQEGGYLNAWLDFKANGSWADPGDQIFDALPLLPGVNNLSFNVPAGATLGRTYARFRYSREPKLPFDGGAPDGEVEDYLVSIIPDRDRCDLACEGRDFWLTFPGNYAPDPDNPTRPRFCILGPAGATGTVAIAGIGFATNFVIPPTLTANIPLPRAADLGDANDAITNKGIHVTASADVSITAFNHARFTTDSYLALNSSAIGTEYIVQGFGNVHAGVPPLNGTQFALVASESNTVVTITPSVATGGHPGGVPYNLVLQAGDAYQLRNTKDAPNDLSGTIIKSDKPIAVFGGHQNTTIPSGTVWFQDYVVEQLLPVNTWGNDFYTAPLATRSNGDTFRLLAAYDNTDVFLNGAPLATLNRGKFVQGQIFVRSHITSSRPIFVAQYATSGDYDGNTNADPFMLTVQATRHYASSYRICTPTNDFPTNYVNLIVPTAAVGTIQIDGVPVGGGAFSVIAGTAYSAAQVLISPGTHLVTGGALFGASVYGWAQYDSYGHPACFFFGDVAPPRVNTGIASVTVSVNDYPNTPGSAPVPNIAGAAQVEDNCSPQPTRPTQTPVPGTLLPPGIYTLAVASQDETGNIGTSNVTFTILDPSPVIITCPPNIVANCAGSNGAIVNFTVSAHTTYDPNVPVVSTPPSGSLFPLGTTVVTSRATSLAGQSASCSFSVTVECRFTVGVARNPNGLTITWTGGTLEKATSVRGPWIPISAATSPFPVSISGTQAFYRIVQ